MILCTSLSDVSVIVLVSLLSPITSIASGRIFTSLLDVNASTIYIMAVAPLIGDVDMFPISKWCT
jgi:hypothetical protein